MLSERVSMKNFISTIVFVCFEIVVLELLVNFVFLLVCEYVHYMKCLKHINIVTVFWDILHPWMSQNLIETESLWGISL